MGVHSASARILLLGSLLGCGTRFTANDGGVTSDGPGADTSDAPATSDGAPDVAAPDAAGNEGGDGGPDTFQCGERAMPQCAAFARFCATGIAGVDPGCEPTLALCAKKATPAEVCACDATEFAQSVKKGPSLTCMCSIDDAGAGKYTILCTGL
jgi:hypothetical protein